MGNIGIVGYGRLGRILARYALAFGMEVVATDPNPISIDTNVEYLDLYELLERSNIVSLHVAYSKDKHKMVDKRFFDKMQEQAILINTSRGELIDETAMLNALSSGKLAGVAADVINSEAGQPEEWFDSHPLITYARGNRNLLLTPHIGGATRDAMITTDIFIAEKICHHIKENTVLNIQHKGCK